jgi:hypothetical protein
VTDSLLDGGVEMHIDAIASNVRVTVIAVALFVFLRFDRIILMKWRSYRLEAFRPMDIPLIHIDVYSIHRDHLFNLLLEVKTMAVNMDGITPIENTDKEYLILLANELEKAVSNDNGQEGFIRISNELALILAKRIRYISKKSLVGGENNGKCISSYRQWRGYRKCRNA